MSVSAYFPEILSLASMADSVCRKVRRIDDEAQTQCKQFMRDRMRLIYDDQLWRDSLMGIEITLDPEDVNGADGIYLLPNSVDRVVMARASDREIRYKDELEFYRIDPDEFANSGRPEVYHELRPVVIATPDDAGMTVTIAALDATDVGVEVRLSYWNASNYLVDAVVTLTEAGDAISAVREIYSISKPTTSGVVLMSYLDTALPLIATATHWPASPRMRFVNKPTESTALRVLVKMRLHGWDGDNDRPPLRGVTNCLMAYAQGDMLQWQRQYGKAQVVYEEAGALLDQYKRIGVWQGGQRIQLTPEVGEISGWVDSGLQGKGYV